MPEGGTLQNKTGWNNRTFWIPHTSNICDVEVCETAETEKNCEYTDTVFRCWSERELFLKVHGVPAGRNPRCLDPYCCRHYSQNLQAGSTDVRHRAPLLMQCFLTSCKIQYFVYYKSPNIGQTLVEKSAYTIFTRMAMVLRPLSLLIFMKLGLPCREHSGPNETLRYDSMYTNV
jgi:hypothetical protein